MLEGTSVCSIILLFIKKIVFSIHNCISELHDNVRLFIITPTCEGVVNDNGLLTELLDIFIVSSKCKGLIDNIHYDETDTSNDEIINILYLLIIYILNTQTYIKKLYDRHCEINLLCIENTQGTIDPLMNNSKMNKLLNVGWVNVFVGLKIF